MNKKVIFLIVLTILLAFSTIGFAGDFPDGNNDKDGGFKIVLSSGVVGTYWVNVEGKATECSMSTAHEQGNRAYATSSNDQAIYYFEPGHSPIVSGDLLDEHNPSFVSDHAKFTKTL